jgi:hypothetical protein
MRTTNLGTLVLGTLLVLALSPAAFGQYYGGWGGNYYHASTEAEGIQRGFADFIRSAGAASLMNAEATSKYEDARKKYLENRLQATQTYFDMRRLNAEARRSERSLPLSLEAYQRLARQQAPDRLSVSQLDPLTGTITWPAPLQRADYLVEREELERLYRERATGVDPNYDDIRTASDRLVQRLTTDIDKFEPNDFIRAKKFVESLAHETRLAQR